MSLSSSLMIPHVRCYLLTLRQIVSSLSGVLDLALATLLFLLLLVGFDLGVAAGGIFVASAYEVYVAGLLFLEPGSDLSFNVFELSLRSATSSGPGFPMILLGSTLVLCQLFELGWIFLHDSV